MRVASGVVFYYSLFLAFGWSQSVGSEPSPIEAFADRQGVRTVWSVRVARWEHEGTGLVNTALVLEDNAPSSRKLRGVKIDLSSGNAKDQIYLDEQATERTRSALEEIADAVARSGVPGSNGCIGAKEFWPLYDWPWNKYHELNIDLCSDSKNLGLVLYGRGKHGSFRFPDKSPADLDRILASAMEQLKQQ